MIVQKKHSRGEIPPSLYSRIRSRAIKSTRAQGVTPRQRHRRKLTVVNRSKKALQKYGQARVKHRMLEKKKKKSRAAAAARLSPTHGRLGVAGGGWFSFHKFRAGHVLLLSKGICELPNARGWEFTAYPITDLHGGNSSRCLPGWSIAQGTAG